MAVSPVAAPSSDAILDAVVGKEQEVVRDEIVRLNKAYAFLKGDGGAVKLLERAEKSNYGQDLKSVRIVIQYIHSDFAEAIHKIDAAIAELNISVSGEVGLAAIAQNARQARGGLGGVERMAVRRASEHGKTISERIKSLNEAKLRLENGIGIKEPSKLQNLRNIAGYNLNKISADAELLNKFPGYLINLLGLLQSARPSQQKNALRRFLGI